MIWQETDRPLAQRLQAYADLLVNEDARNLLHEAARTLRVATAEALDGRISESLL